MKKVVGIFLLASVILLSACGVTKFDGSRTGNDRQLIMDYKILNKADTQMFELEEGEIIVADIVNISGKLSITIQKDGEEPIYQGNDVPTSAFQVEVKETGSYKAKVVGENAKGSVSLTIEKINWENLIN